MANFLFTKVNVVFWLFCLFAFSVFHAAAMDIDLQAQAIMAVCIIITIVVLRPLYVKEKIRGELADWVRVLIILLGMYLTLRYFFWRTFSTLSYHDFWSSFFSIALYAAEVYGISIYLLGLFVNIKPLKRESTPLPDELSQYPTVDIFIPTYDEDISLLEVTMLSATQIRYPKDKLNIYLLDDGGTDEKRQHPIVEICEAARERHERLQEICQLIGIRYLTRPRNDNAKAGNLNYALTQTHGELILMLDADHVPTVDILEKTVGSFLHDSKLALVQTPHFFINPDPLEKNLESFQHMPSENEMFYSVIQRGLDFWHSSFFCGSAAILRRAPLEQIGGLSTVSVTEDAETAMVLHANGYRSAYLRRPLVSGLQPPTLTDFIRQRVRWAQGMTQIFILKNPLRQKGLRLWQKIAYLNSSYFWFFGFARIIFMLAPTAYLVFGLKIYDANGMEIVAYTIPHLVASILVSNTLFGKVRWTFISELYELMQSFFNAIGVIKVFRNPLSPQFVVTPKQNKLDHNFVSGIFAPFYILLFIIVVTMMFGIYRLLMGTADHDVVIANLFWETINLIVMLGAIGALLEKRQVRRSPRVPVRLPARLFDGKLVAKIVDLSMGGARVIVSDKQFQMPVGNIFSLSIYNRPLKKYSQFNVQVTELFNDKQLINNGESCFGVEFIVESLHKKSELVSLIYGDSDRWRQYLIRRNEHTSVLRSVWFLLKTGLQHTVKHFSWIFNYAMKFLVMLVIRYVQMSWVYIKER